jgi:hypothetical protein
VIYSTDRPVCSAVSSAMRRLSWPSLAPVHELFRSGIERSRIAVLVCAFGRPT